MVPNQNGVTSWNFDEILKIHWSRKIEYQWFVLLWKELGSTDWSLDSNPDLIEFFKLNLQANSPKIPVKGDKTTIETVKEKVNNNIPVVICAGTGSNRVFDYGQGKTSWRHYMT